MLIAGCLLPPHCCAESTLHLVLRLRGGSGGPTLELRVQPRVQRDKWSLYWKESMATVTDACQECALEVAAEGERAAPAVCRVHEEARDACRELSPGGGS